MPARADGLPGPAAELAARAPPADRMLGAADVRPEVLPVRVGPEDPAGARAATQGGAAPTTAGPRQIDLGLGATRRVGAPPEACVTPAGKVVPKASVATEAGAGRTTTVPTGAGDATRAVAGPDPARPKAVPAAGRPVAPARGVRTGATAVRARTSAVPEAAGATHAPTTGTVRALLTAGAQSAAAPTPARRAPAAGNVAPGPDRPVPAARAGTRAPAEAPAARPRAQAPGGPRRRIDGEPRAIGTTGRGARGHRDRPDTTTAAQVLPGTSRMRPAGVRVPRSCHAIWT